GRARPSSPDECGRTIYDVLADFFQLSDLERRETFLDEGKPRSRWENMVRWARRSLKDKGLLASAAHGVWEVTTKGRQNLDLATLGSKSSKRDKAMSYLIMRNDPTLIAGIKASGDLKHGLERFYDENIEAIESLLRSH